MWGYVLSPIDWFRGCPTISEYLQREAQDAGVDVALPLDDLSQLLAAMEQMKWWEGDVRGDIHVFSLPMPENEMVPGLVWKQDNNGTTFVLSPLELPWLNGSCFLDDGKPQRITPHTDRRATISLRTARYLRQSLDRMVEDKSRATELSALIAKAKTLVAALEAAIARAQT